MFPIPFEALLGLAALFMARVQYWTTQLKAPTTPAAQFLTTIPGNATKEYDFIIVGAGTAGSVVASRLAEHKHWKILLLEAGPPESFSHTFPLVHIADPQATFLDWNFTTVPQKWSGAGLNGRQNLMSAGRVVGGTSSINHLLYIRGNREDYDMWAKEGADGWSWKDVFPYFLKSENNQNPDLVKTGLHGSNGPLRIEDNPNQEIYLADLLFRAAKAKNLYNPDSNGESQLGFAPTQINAFHGYRWSAASAYLRPDKQKHRRNLHVISNAQVARIVIDPRTKQTTGVEFMVVDGVSPLVSRVVSVRKEVILSAGAINSPKILMLSGIGSAAELRKNKIEPLSDLPVGENLQDHLQVQMVFNTNDTEVGLNMAELTDPKQISRYAKDGTGLFSASSVVSFGFFHIPELAAQYGTPPTFPHIQTAIVNTAMYPPEELILRQNMAPETIPQYYTKPENMGKPGFIISPLFLHPKSRGTVKLADNNPMSPPVIDPRFLSEEEDVKVYAKGFKFVADFFLQSEEFKKVGITPNFPSFPVCAALPAGSEEYYECIIRYAARSAYHPVGTCKMGKSSDASTVVDSSLRVKGISKLRVADASIIPTIISGNTHAPTVMIGEKAADMVASAWGSKTDFSKKSQYEPKLFM
ncbi:hypothetical protein RvY_05365 [Ramazzottius varieornatus]|uniref:Glucose-methanol-choline oxidoreductase N-terminal domain-containing protein n=1 Tax=Ramazzottius varieornatus TaxID=947166 RepID=A0A1D1UXV3_RAMVA|nr:hypothetical protein RvY_05365 [Ramazzottius varieornatus]